MCRRCSIIAAISLLAFYMIGWARMSEGQARALAGQLLGGKGVRQGLCVQLGSSDGALVEALTQGGHRLVQCLDINQADVDQTRKYLQQKGVYGIASVDKCDFRRLPYRDIMVTVLVVPDFGSLKGRGLTVAEMARVVAPYGSAFIGGHVDAAALKKELGSLGIADVSTVVIDGKTWLRFVKPYPAAMDEWSQFRHDPGLTATSNDSILGPARGVQWIDGPMQNTSSRPAQSILAANGRMFYVRNAYKYGDNKVHVEARDAFNGLVLWDRVVYVPKGARQGVVLAGDLVLAYVDSTGPLTALDQATGATIRDYGIRGGDFFVYKGLAVIRDAKDSWSVLDPANGKILRKFVGNWKGWYPGADAPGAAVLEMIRGNSPQIVVADDKVCIVAGPDSMPVKKVEGAEAKPSDAKADTGRRRDAAKKREPLGTSLVCFDFNTGALLWKTANRDDGDFVSCTHGLIVTRADAAMQSERGNLHCYSLADGSWKWRYDLVYKKGGKPAVFYMGGNLWTYDVLPLPPYTKDGPYAAIPDSLRKGTDPNYVALDPLTGKILNKDPGFAKEMGRCGPDYASPRYILAMDMIVYDLQNVKGYGSYFTRGDCGISYTPANGMMYNCGNQCACNPYIPGMMAVTCTPESASVDVKTRLEKGPAFGAVKAAAPAADAWPMYRHDPYRSAVTRATVPADLTVKWRAAVGKVITGPVAAGKLVLTASVDEHRVVALDAASGKVVWSHVTGGRIDTPPTILEDLILFGSRDGWVYCVKASDGALVWRFRAAPEDRRIVVRGQIESLWPINGTILVDGGLAYVAAGRHGDADGGIWLYALEPATGAVAWEKRISAFPPIRTDPNRFMIPDRYLYERECTYNDILISDGRTLFLGALGIDLKSREALVKPAGAALIGNVPTFLNDNTVPMPGMSVRSEWYLTGRQWGTEWRRTFGETRANLFALDTPVCYGIRHSEYLNHWTQGDSNRVASIFAFSSAGGKEQMIRGSKRFGPVELWNTEYNTGNLLLKSLLVAGDNVFVACQPGAGLIAGKDAKAGEVLVHGAKDGILRKRIDIGSGPLFDGLAAVPGSLYVSLQDGELVCLR